MSLNCILNATMDKGMARNTHDIWFVAECGVSSGRVSHYILFARQEFDGVKVRRNNRHGNPNLAIFTCLTNNLFGVDITFAGLPDYSEFLPISKKLLPGHRNS